MKGLLHDKKKPRSKTRLHKKTTCAPSANITHGCSPQNPNKRISILKDISELCRSGNNLPLFVWAAQMPKTPPRLSVIASQIQRRHNVSPAYARIIESDYYGVAA